VLKGELARLRPQLSRVWVDALVVLTADDAVLVDRSDRADADAHDVTNLAELVPALGEVSRVRNGFPRDIRRHRRTIIEALLGSVRLPMGPQRLARTGRRSGLASAGAFRRRAFEALGF
jgi:hypothetical protein